MTDRLKTMTSVYRMNLEDSLKTTYSKVNMNVLNIRDEKSMVSIEKMFPNETIGIPPSYSCKKKKNGGSDPRFKRVISSESKNGSMEKKIAAACAAQALRILNDDKPMTEKVVSYLKAPNEMLSAEVSNKMEIEKENYLENLMVTKDLGFQPVEKFPQEYAHPMHSKETDFISKNLQVFESYEKPKFNCNTKIKRSISDCTLRTKCSNLDDDELPQEVKTYPSSSRLRRVQNWMKDYKLSAEKRRSVITIIGQTRNQPFSKVLSEITQRRKLAKELDKHALCKAITDSEDSQPEVKNLIAKVDFVLPDGKVIYSTEKIYMCKGSSQCKVNKISKECSKRSFDIFDNEKLRRRYEMIPEKDSSISQTGKRSKRRTSRKSGLTFKEKITLSDSLRPYLYKLPAVLCIGLTLLCIILCMCAIHYSLKNSNSFRLFGLFRPKSRSWYKKLIL